MEFSMQAFSTYPAEINCTCGYLPSAMENDAPLANPELTSQIGYLLILLGSMFIDVPMFKLHISRSTADLLISIGTKLTKSAKRAERVVS